MVNQESLAINFSRPILTSQAEVLLANFSEIPLANVLVELFREVADPQTFRAALQKGGLIIYAQIKYGDVVHSVSLGMSQILGKFDQVILRVYAGPLRLVPASGFENTTCPNIVSVSAGALKTGAWLKNRGNKMTHGIVVSFSKGFICLPSQGGKWLFSFLNRLAQLANEFHLDINQQPEFWELEGRFRENNG